MPIMWRGRQIGRCGRLGSLVRLRYRIVLRRAGQRATNRRMEPPSRPVQRHRTCLAYWNSRIRPMVQRAIPRFSPRRIAKTPAQLNVGVFYANYFSLIAVRNYLFNTESINLKSSGSILFAGCAIPASIPTLANPAAISSEQKYAPSVVQSVANTNAKIPILL